MCWDKRRRYNLCWVCYECYHQSVVQRPLTGAWVSVLDPQHMTSSTESLLFIRGLLVSPVQMNTVIAVFVLQQKVGGWPCNDKSTMSANMRCGLYLLVLLVDSWRYLKLCYNDSRVCHPVLVTSHCAASARKHWRVSWKQECIISLCAVIVGSDTCTQVSHPFFYFSKFGDVVL